MSPITFLIVRDVESASASYTGSAVPAPTSSITPHVTSMPFTIPNWAVYAGIIFIFACMLAVVMYFASRRLSDDITLRIESGQLGLSADKNSPSSSSETLINEKAQIPQPVIAKPPPAYNPSAENVALRSEAAFDRSTAINTLRNQRQSVQIFEPIMSEAL
ncbi:hypothetical protein C8R44DRAFT_754871 [Mycena epipterygia]|nr:hypothetical protein C8R44DRAFT_754871 [Mycena epipterygia]